MNADRGEVVETILRDLYDTTSVAGPLATLVDATGEPSGNDRADAFRFEPSDPGFAFSNVFSHWTAARDFTRDVLEAGDPEALPHLERPGFVVVGIHPGDRFFGTDRWTRSDACNASVETEEIIEGYPYFVRMGAGGHCPGGSTATRGTTAP